MVQCWLYGLFSNRVLVFGLFNFEDDFKLSKRIEFVHNQLDSFPYMKFMNGWSGFLATAVWSLAIGLVVMVGYEIIGAFGQAVFESIRTFRNWLLAKAVKSNWRPKKDLDEMQRKYSELEQKLHQKIEEVGRNQNFLESTREKSSELERLIVDKDKRIESMNLEVEKLNEEVKKNVEERKKFRVIYAGYGVDGKYIEVTRVVNGLLASRGKFLATNDILGFDPLGYAIKN